MEKINKVSRLILFIGSLSVIATYFLPLWEIKLWAPQYPEGLTIEIWHNDVKGDVEIINGLNHYIGMRHIKKEMFPEFNFLKYIIAAFILWGMFVAVNGKRKWLKIYCITIILGGILALGDFYRWGYDYGHNLDPTAPIQVPGMAYQPPVLGYKVLLNFVALSIPSTGGWIVVGLATLAFIMLGFDWFKNRLKGKAVLLFFVSSISLAFVSCMEIQPKINFGKDDCDHCRMKIMDNHFGFVIMTDKGRLYKFDDMNCLIGYKRENAPQIKKEFAVLFDKPGMMVQTNEAFFIHSQQIQSPMGSGVAAFSSQEVCKSKESSLHAICTTYSALQQMK